MARIRTLLGVIAGTLAAAALAATPPQATLLALETTWLHAIQTRDVDTLQRILAEDFIDINYKGIVRTKADALAAPNVPPGSPAQTLSDEQVRTWGRTAVVTGRGTMVIAGTARHWRFTDVFVQRAAGHWQVVSSQETAEAD
jgi:ketosteroid isomerase-like protein